MLRYISGVIQQSLDSDLGSLALVFPSLSQMPHQLPEHATTATLA